MFLLMILVFIGLAIIFVYSLLSAVITEIKNAKKRFKKKEEEKRKKAIFEATVNELKSDCDNAFSDPIAVKQIIQKYQCFCDAFRTAMQSCEEKYKITVANEPSEKSGGKYDVLKVTIKKVVYYIHPVGILIVRDALNDYQYIRFEKDTISMSEEERETRIVLAPDIRPIKQYRSHVCNDGSPDRRFKDNPMMFVYVYGVLTFDKMKLHYPRVNIAKDAINAYNKLYSSICMLKSGHNTSTQNMPTTYEEDVHKEQESTTKLEGATNVGFKWQAVNNASCTLEEWFYNVLAKNGLDILGMNSLFVIFSNSYKNPDKKDFNNIVQKMSEEKFCLQFVKPNKQKDFVMYNTSVSFARKYKLDASKCLFVVQSLISAINKYGGFYKFPP